MKKIIISLLLILISIKLFSQDEKVGLSSSLYLQSINVTIGGSFIVTGSFPAFPNERVDQFVSRTFNEARENYLRMLQNRQTQGEIDIYQLLQERNNIDEFALRNISLKRSNGTELKLDLAKFRINGDFKNNPYLQNDDVLVFPVLDFQKDFFSIEGAINQPGKYQYVEGDKLSDAIELALGINPAYENIQNISISRLNYNGTKEDVFIYNISDNPEIKRGDRIRIIADETQKRDFRVNVNGEVNQPGYIPITKNNTTIREVILKAGGFKPIADLNRAEIIRGANVFRGVIFSEQFEAMMMNRMSNITKDDSLTFAIDNQLRFSRGNGIIDFNRVLDSTSRDSKFIVKDGDYIFIPEKLNLVYVFGQVNNPGYVEYVSDRDWNYYISKAGGIGEMAKDEVYLIKGESRSWVSLKKDKSQIIEPGDYIWVAKKNPRTFDYYLNRIMAVSSVVGTLATLVLIIIQAGK
ncbi:MAG: hypothetical protein STSR0008_03660 [Ignavibacterium sp.]